MGPLRIIVSFPEVMNSMLRLHMESQQKYTQSVLDFLLSRLNYRTSDIVTQESLTTLPDCLLQQETRDCVSSEEASNNYPFAP